MKTALAVLLVLFAACPALGSEFMTNNATLVYEKPDRKSDVVGEIPMNVKISSDERKDYWFHVTVQLDDKEVSGWVNQQDVTDMMGRSKGQLLAENDRLYGELVELRKTVKELQAGFAAALEENKTLNERLQAAAAESEPGADQPAAPPQESASAKLRKAQEENARLAEELEKTRAELADARAENERLSEMLEELRRETE